MRSMLNKAICICVGEKLTSLEEERNENLYRSNLTFKSRYKVLIRHDWFARSVKLKKTLPIMAYT
jgi:hypothetical protein